MLYSTWGQWLSFGAKKDVKMEEEARCAKFENVQRKKIVMDAGNAKNLKHVKN